ncbi:MAG: TetR/AcrR family transcriptional regulator [Nocardioides sp.]|uniref:TetR/AcrR family transcriptional regulator n=1 Tax=Nocardioides sp. TaxID=35761 RepID=UPI0039E252FB
MSRRDELLDAVTDHVLEHGIIGLTLRPVAAAIGTSDRMLIYHFGTREGLVSAVVERASDRGTVELHRLPAARGVRAAVRALWAAYQVDPLRGCLSVYLQAAATGVIGQEPFVTDVRASNDRWCRGLRDFLARSGTPVDRVDRIITLVDSALVGFLLDLTTDRPEELSRGVDDLAIAAALIAER